MDDIWLAAKAALEALHLLLAAESGSARQQARESGEAARRRLTVLLAVHDDGPPADDGSVLMKLDYAPEDAAYDEECLFDHAKLTGEFCHNCGAPADGATTDA